MSGNIIIQNSPQNDNRISKILNVQSLLWLALVLALAGSLRHVAAMFASVDGNTVFGWLQAIAIDAGLFALAYGIKNRKVARRSVKPLWFGVLLFSVISIYGNLAYGLLATSGNLPLWILASRPYVLAASLPVLVLYLAELLSDDRQHAATEAAKEEKKIARQMAKSEQVSDLPSPLTGINAERIATKEQRKRQLLAIHRQKPEATVTELAERLDVSRGTIRNYASELAISLASSGNGRGER